MGHFNRVSMQISTMTMVYPAIMAAYIGQGKCCELQCCLGQTNCFALPTMSGVSATGSNVHSNADRKSLATPGAYLLGVPSSVDPQPNSGTFWKSLPGGPGLFWPMFIVAILAAIVASQALISAVFQIAYQAIAQGFFPRFHVYHTSRTHTGQVWGSTVPHCCAVPLQCCEQLRPC